MFDPEVNPGVVISNAQLVGIFKCGTQGGMRRSHKTNTLVLTSGHLDDVVYEDRWIGDVLHYTGMGLIGDQDLHSAQNRTLLESPESGIDVHLFEVHKERQYTYIGRVKLVDSPYQEQQPDAKSAMRQVWVFPLGLTNPVPPLSQAVFNENEQRRAGRAHKLTDEELAKRAAAAPRGVGQRTVTAPQYERDPYVAEHARRRAKGHCELCDKPAPFMKPTGDPYLETHHIVWLAHGGPDSIENTVAVCPNCHRRLHVLDLESDRLVLLARAGRGTKE